MTKLEEIARAICFGDPDQLVHDMVITDHVALGISGTPTGPLHPLWMQFIDRARAAVEALRVPTPDMLIMGAQETWEPESDRQYIGEYQIGAAYRAMIDAILNEKP